MILLPSLEASHVRQLFDILFLEGKKKKKTFPEKKTFLAIHLFFKLTFCFFFFLSFV
jgi:hypothetical protein